ncbi:MAG: T9SS type A sorting domain-containing protein [Bacteroidales bacterium]|nr:T9SS type A sorting domain-containing protein [Bacteroidales bacterium]
MVRFNKKASIAFDPAPDAYEFSKTAGDINLWSIFNDIDYSINGLPFPESKIEIPLGINNVKTGILILSASEIRLLDNYSVNLKDIKTNTTIDLKKGERFTFNADAGITENRFILSIANLTTDVPEIVIPEKKFKIYSSFGSINIVSLTDEYGSIPGSVTIYDLTGRKILQKNNLEWNGKGDLNQIVMNSAEKGLFIIELKSGNKKHIEKVNISR